jgi:hypothetical protein
MIFIGLVAVAGKRTWLLTTPWLQGVGVTFLVEKLPAVLPLPRVPYFWDLCASGDMSGESNLDMSWCYHIVAFPPQSFPPPSPYASPLQRSTRHHDRGGPAHAHRCFSR